MLRTAFVGWPKVGKTTLFSLITGLSAEHSSTGGGKYSQHIGITDVPDFRLEALAEVFNPKKVVPAQIEFMDLAGIAKGEAKDAVYLAHLRNVDALAHVLRSFRDPTVMHVEGDVNPVRDLELFEMELVLADLSLLEARIERIGKDLKKMKNKALEDERHLLERLIPWLEQGKPLRQVTFPPDEEKLVRGFTLLSLKPMLFILNMDEEDTRRQEEVIQELGLAEYKNYPKTALVTVCAKIESEIAELPEEEVDAFLKDLGYSEPGLSRLITQMYRLLDLVSFLTAGDQEVRAWPVPRNCPAPQAAGTVHSDFEKGFIRAEVIPWDKLVACRGYAGAREKGWLRQEGKNYPIHDGDTIIFRFNV